LHAFLEKNSQGWLPFSSYLAKKGGKRLRFVILQFSNDFLDGQTRGLYSHCTTTLIDNEEKFCQAISTGCRYPKGLIRSQMGQVLTTQSICGMKN
jgi:hypothetical protein